jgi:hypothetical protein
MSPLSLFVDSGLISLLSSCALFWSENESGMSYVHRQKENLVRTYHCMSNGSPLWTRWSQMTRSTADACCLTRDALCLCQPQRTMFYSTVEHNTTARNLVDRAPHESLNLVTRGRLI